MEPIPFSRRKFLRHASALSASSLIGLPVLAIAEAQPEVRRIRFLGGPAICGAPETIAEELLLAEGIRVEHIEPHQVRGAKAIAEGLADIAMYDVQATLPVLDSGGRVVVLAGVHAGCWQLFANDRVHTLRDLKGRTAAIRGFGIGDHIMLASMLAYVGMDPHRDVKWLAGPTVTDALSLFADGKADAYMAFEPQPHELRSRKIGHVVLDTAQDRPWSQYFCCLVLVQRDFLEANPVATKRALRAILKGADACAQEPERVARLLASKGVESRYEVGLHVVKSLPFDRWRHADPEDTMRFFALRLHEVGMIKTSPQKLVTQGSDWRLLNELKKELKA
jgi:NitT/TauT family transport system substrate-binding protein